MTLWLEETDPRRLPETEATALYIEHRPGPYPQALLDHWQVRRDSALRRNTLTTIAGRLRDVIVDPTAGNWRDFRDLGEAIFTRTATGYARTAFGDELAALIQSDRKRLADKSA
jgi:hypothetical protein